MKLTLTIISAVLLSVNAFAWGPHGEIAQAALDAMGANDPLVRQLGPDAKRLTQYVWMADLRQSLLVRSDEVFYADDYLLFPAATRHYQHICPEVEQTYSPYFRRALQALRTESTHNASRWIGSLLHFTTDTGSPPHAAGFLGPAHSKMENWVDAKAIHIPGYQPQLLGADDASAEAGFLRRMQGLIEFSKERAQRCRADVDADRRPPVEPVVLESALETARVTADLLHTLGVLAAKATDDATLTGTVIVPKIEHATMSRLSAKVVLLGTSYSTLTEPDGTFTFRHLPAGEYRLVVIAPGRVSEAKPVSLAAAATVTLEPLDLSQGTDGNLVRNGTFTVRWVSAEAFDHWSLRSLPGKLVSKTPAQYWDGEWIPLQSGVTYHLTARWKATAADANGPQVFLRTKAKPDGGAITTDSAPVVQGTKELAVIGSPEVAWAQVCIRTSQSPDTVLEAVSLRQAPPTAVTSAPRDPVMRLKLLPPGPDNPRNGDPAFLQLKDGRILMVYSHFTGKQGADESPCYLAGRYSSDGGKTWTKEDVRIVSSDESRMGNVMSPSLLRLRDGRIALFYLRLNVFPLDDRPIMRVSTDEAQTWSEPRVCIGENEVGFYILNNDRVVQLKSGRLVLPLARHDDVTKPSQFNDYPRTLCYLSDDSGQTWRRSKTVLDGIPASGNRVALQEPGVVELKDGRLMMFCRTHTGYIYRSFSSDGGDTWSPAVRYPGLFAPISAAAIERIPKTGDLMMVWNDHTGIATAATSPYKGKRTPYNVAISRDEGETWENSKTLEDDPDGWYCYTAIEFVGNDVLLGHTAGWQHKQGDAPGHETKLALTQLTRFPLSFLYDGPPISAAPVFTKGKRIQIFVLTGQSNSLGTTADPDEKDITPGNDPLDAQIPFFWSNRSTRAGDGPAMLYGNSGGKIVTLRAQQGEGVDPMFWGPEIGFGRTLAAAGTKDFMIVKASRGGGGNSYWLKGNGDDHMYRHVVETVRAAVQQLPAGTEFEIVGLLYLQGESDHAAEAAVAGERLLALAANLRKDLPKAAAMKVLVSGVVPSGKNLDLVRAQQSALPAVDPSFRYLDNMAWKPRRYDGAHYVKPAKLELGQRLGKMWLEWAK